MLGLKWKPLRTMSMPPDDPLDPLLDRWSSTPEPSSRLSATVWQQIATHEAAADRDQHPLAVLLQLLGRPAFALGFVAACALLGLFLAEIRISYLQRERNAQLARSYLQLIDPLLNAQPQERRS
jgi:hypothetical protein